MVRYKNTKKAVSKNVKKRPIGAVIVAVYYFIIGIFGLIASIMIFALGNTIIDMFSTIPIFKLIGSAIGIFLLLISIIYLIIGHGIWKLKKWAQIVATVFAAFGLFGGLLSMVLSIVIILLLWVHKDIKGAFK